MSLTSFLAIKEVKERFRQEFQMPVFAIKSQLLAAPLSNRYSLVGTAFDYLLRFYLKRLNPDAVTHEWIAEHSINHPLSPLLNDIIINSDTGKIISYTETNLTKKATQIIEQAKVSYSEYLLSGQITDRLMKTTLCLAQLDPIFRARVIDQNLGNVSKEDVDDLHNLIAIVQPELFKAKNLCVLSPNFGEASRLVGGADADLFIDRALIDIKTTKRPELQRDYFDQLIGYFVLHQIGGISGLIPKPEISTVAVYFSRYAHLYTIDLQSVIRQGSFSDFVNWFVDRAKQEHANKLSFLPKS